MSLLEELLAERGIKIAGSSDKFTEQEKYAELGRLVNKGVDEVFPHTACKGIYQSRQCRDINSDVYGCVLKYYCPKTCRITGR